MLCFICAAQLKFDFKLTSEAKIQPFLQAGKTYHLLLTFLTKVTRWSRSTSNFSTLIGQNLTGEFMRKIYATSYSETGCSFARHFAIFSRNVGILIGSLLRASCELKFQLAVSCNWFSSKTPW